MWQVITNAVIYTIILLVYWRKRSTLNVGFVTISLYTFVAIMCVFQYLTDPLYWKLQFWPFLYIVLIFLLFLAPIIRNERKIYRDLKTNNIKTLIILSNIYIVASIFVIFFYTPRAINAFQTGDWLSNYEDINKGYKALYDNQIERISINIVNYFNIAAIVLNFYFWTLPTIRKIRKNLLFISIISTTLLINVVKSSRGMLLVFVLTMLTCFLIFREGIPKKLVRTFLTFSSVFLVFLFMYVISVTISRFGAEEKNSSIIWYFGQSYLYFNYGLADTIHTFFNGEFFFGWFKDLLYGEKSFSIDYVTGTHFGTNFFTFVGAWYLDFGPIGTLIIALIFPLIIFKAFIERKHTSIANIFMFVYYLKYLYVGVFVIGRGDALQWLMAILIYYILSLNIKFSKNGH